MALGGGFLNLAGTAENLSTLLGITSTYGKGMYQLTIKAKAGNAGNVYVYHLNTVSASLYDVILPANIAYTWGPFSASGLINTDNFFILGTAGDDIEVSLVE